MTIWVLLLALCAPVAAGAQALAPLPYNALAARMPEKIGFETLPAQAEPGVALDHPFAVPGAQIGVRFAGQSPAVLVTRAGHRFDDLGQRRADAPLRLVPDPPGQGLAFARHRGFGSVAVFPLGPDGFAARSGRGEGSLAVLFKDDQPGVGLLVHSDYADPLGARDAPPGAVQLIVLGRDGAVIGVQVIRLGPGITPIAVQRDAGQRDIAGFVLLNSDPGGIAVDDILLARAPLLGQRGPMRAPLTTPAPHRTVAAKRK